MTTPEPGNVLISGASIAGPMGGQNIDVNGPAQKIARKMGIEEAIRAANTGEVGLQFIGQTNRVATRSLLWHQ